MPEESLFEPRFPDAWSRQPLFFLARWVNGIAFRDIHFSESGKPVIKIAEVKNGLSQQTKFTQQVFDDDVRIRPGDLIFSWSGQPETSIDAFWWRGPEGWLNQHLFRVTPTPVVDKTFLFYLLRYLRPTFIQIARNKQTTGLGHVTRRDLEALSVGVPPFSEQRAIAEVLGALDDKIEANRRVARLLEQRLSAMFLQFGFDELGNSGNDVVRLCEIIEVNPPRMKIELEVASYIDMAALPTDSALVAKPAYRKPKSGARFVNGDTLMARITPCLENGKVAFVDCLASTEVGTGSTEFLVLRPREPLPAEFAYFLARSERFSTYAVQHMSGSSGRQRCPAEAIERYKIARPDMIELASFGDLAGPAFAMMRATVNESVVLADLRDTLLPKLMSGELRVRDAELLVEDAV
jgi:type I restriction enzyme S subunit